jgi:hypothetical protein
MKNATPQVIFSATLILASILFTQNFAKAQALNLYPAATGINDSARLLTTKDEEKVRTLICGRDRNGSRRFTGARSSCWVNGSEKGGYGLTKTFGMDRLPASF